ncbi:hypothetical protein [Klebsiella aerogenes]|uniref:hypothetical protein n=1 Tax=Klebsiella aerogenes TaxID=548 RepID=UPI002FF8C1AB
MAPVHLQLVAADRWMGEGVRGVATAAGMMVVDAMAPRTVRVWPGDLRGQLEAFVALAVWWVNRPAARGGHRLPLCTVLTDLPRDFVLGTLRAQLPGETVREVTRFTLRVLPPTATVAELQQALTGGPVQPVARPERDLRPLPAGALQEVLRWLNAGGPDAPALPPVVAARAIRDAMRCLGVTVPGRLWRWCWQSHSRRHRYRGRTVGAPRRRAGTRRRRTDLMMAMPGGPARSGRTGDGVRVALVDPCFAGRQGLEEALLLSPAVSRVRPLADPASLLLPEAGVGGPAGIPDVLVVRLPVQPCAALGLLLQLSVPPLSRLPVGRLLLLTPFDRRCMTVLLDAYGTPWPLVVLPSRLSVMALTASVCSPDGGRDRALLCRDRPSPGRLSWRESDVLQQSLRGISLLSQADRRCRSRKTLYAQQVSGLHKLGVTSLATLLLMFTPEHTPGGRLRPDLPDTRNPQEATRR